MSSAVPAPAPPPEEQLRKAAGRYLAAGYAIRDPRQRLDACADHLAVTFGIEAGRAADITLAAWSELHGRATQARFDLAASTPWLVFVDDPVAGTRHALAVEDLLRLMGPRGVPTSGPPPRAPDPPGPDVAA